MAKMFGKKITTAEQVKLYNEYKVVSERRKQLVDEKYEKMMSYAYGEGRYSTGKEEKLYYKENVEYLDKELDEINSKMWAAEKALCVALWGYGPEVYRQKQELKTAEKELKEQMAYVERLRRELAELEEKEA